MFGFGSAKGEKFETISGPEAAERVSKGALLVDVREVNEFASGHIDGAINVPLSSFASDAKRIPPNRDVILYCAAGVRSERALGACANLGLPHETHVAGGISALARAGMRVRTS